jgi:hypothetical protein
VLVISARRRWAVGALLVSLGWLASPSAVPVYDGLGQPDEPYRYVTAPKGATKTVPPEGVTATSPVKDGRNTNGLSVQTAEQGPQVSVFLPQFSLASDGSLITVRITPEAPVGGPAGMEVDGNVYRVELTDPAGPVTLTERAAVATLYLRATSQEQPQPTMYYRPSPSGEWKALSTTAGGLDVRVASFVGAGDYVVARAPSKDDGGGAPVLPLVLVGVLVLLVGVVLVVRLRASTE